MKIVVTGADGLIGKHLLIHFGRCVAGFEPQGVDRASFADLNKLATILSDADVVVHCAGVNRGHAEAVERGNLDIACQLTEALNAAGAQPHLIYTNSVQKQYDTPYGRGKCSAHKEFERWARGTKALYSELVLPHVFGEGGRPFYNSAVHTFCSQIARGEELEINAGGSLELIHAQDVAALVADIVFRHECGERRAVGRPMSVPELAGRLLAMHAAYAADVIPNLSETVELQLFNTLRSYLYPSFYPRPLTLHTDDRGSLFEAVKGHSGGQTFLSSTRPGVTRGNHFHINKVERFLVLQGEAIIRLRSLLDQSSAEFRVTGDAPAYIDMPTLHTHSITNTGSGDLLTLFWSHEIFNPEQPDTYAEAVLASEG